ncbi:MAG TPA: hypothetical protein VJG29_00735 [Candidatus Paceibacterota bacterium]
MKLEELKMRRSVATFLSVLIVGLVLAPVAYAETLLCNVITKGQTITFAIKGEKCSIDFPVLSPSGARAEPDVLHDGEFYRLHLTGISSMSARATLSKDGTLLKTGLMGRCKRASYVRWNQSDPDGRNNINEGVPSKCASGDRVSDR